MSFGFGGLVANSQQRSILENLSPDFASALFQRDMGRLQSAWQRQQDVREANRYNAANSAERAIASGNFGFGYLSPMGAIIRHQARDAVAPYQNDYMLRAIQRDAATQQYNFDAPVMRERYAQQRKDLLPHVY